MVIGLIGTVFTAVILAVVLKVPVIRVIIITALCISGSLLINSLNLMVDIMRPKLDWKSPQEAVKRNINGVVGILVTLIIIAAAGFLTYLVMSLGVPDWVTYLAIFLIMSGAGIPVTIALLSVGEYRYEKLEV